MNGLPDQPDVKGDAQKVLRWFNSIMISLGAFFAFGFWTEWKDSSKKNVDRMESLQSAVNRLDTNAQVTEAKESLDGRFIAQDSKVLALDRRVEKVEDASTAIKDALRRMETTIGSNPNNSR